MQGQSPSPTTTAPTPSPGGIQGAAKDKTAATGETNQSPAQPALPASAGDDRGRPAGDKAGLQVPPLGYTRSKTQAKNQKMSSAIDRGEKDSRETLLVNQALKIEFIECFSLDQYLSVLQRDIEEANRFLGELEGDDLDMPQPEDNVMGKPGKLGRQSVFNLEFIPDRKLGNEKEPLKDGKALPGRAANKEKASNAPQDKARDPASRQRLGDLIPTDYKANPKLAKARLAKKEMILKHYELGQQVMMEFSVSLYGHSWRVVKSKADFSNFVYESKNIFKKALEKMKFGSHLLPGDPFEGLKISSKELANHLKNEEVRAKVAEYAMMLVKFISDKAEKEGDNEGEDDDNITFIKFREFWGLSRAFCRAGFKRIIEVPVEKYSMGRANELACIRCCKQLFQRKQDRWLFIAANNLWYYKHSNEEPTNISDNIMVDRSTTVCIYELSKESLVIDIKMSRRTLRVRLPFFSGLFAYKCLVQAFMESHYAKVNRFDSFAPIRSKNTCKLYVDGEGYFSDLANLIKHAEQDVMMTGWFISPEMPLTRPVGKDQAGKLCKDHDSLISLLKAAADRGVKVYILVYQEFSMNMYNDSEHCKNALTQLSKNIKVLRHPTTVLQSLLWSHHEKSVIIDRKTVMMGGLDVAWGRWDTQTHDLFDYYHGRNFPGVDYYNAYKKDIVKGREYEHALIKKDDCRMPWHDVACQLKGEIVMDYLTHFVTYWSNSREINEENEVLFPLISLTNPQYSMSESIRRIVEAKPNGKSIIKQLLHHKIKPHLKKTPASVTSIKSQTSLLVDRSECLRTVFKLTDENIVGRKMQAEVPAIRNDMPETKYDEMCDILDRSYHRQDFCAPRDENSISGVEDFKCVITTDKHVSFIKEKPANHAEHSVTPTTQEKSTVLEKTRDVSTNFIYESSEKRSQEEEKLLQRIKIEMKKRSEWKQFDSISKERSKIPSLILKCQGAGDYITRVKSLDQADEENIWSPDLPESRKQLPRNEYSLPIESLPAEIKSGLFCQTAKAIEEDFFEMQALRSASFWSIGLTQSEKSIQNAYLNMIDNAKHYVYIENQFFISCTTQVNKDSSNNVTNRIVKALFRRIKRAVDEGHNFKVIVFIPLMPAFEGDIRTDDSGLMQAQIALQIKTMGEKLGGLYHQIQSITSNPKKYIMICGLRKHQRPPIDPIAELKPTPRSQGHHHATHGSSENLHQTNLKGQKDVLPGGQQPARPVEPTNSNQWSAEKKHSANDEHQRVERVPEDLNKMPKTELIYIHSKVRIGDRS